MKIEKGFGGRRYSDIKITFDFGSWEGDAYMLHLSFFGFFMYCNWYSDRNGISGKILRGILGKGRYIKTRTIGVFFGYEGVGIYLPNMYEKQEGCPKYIGVKWGKYFDKLLRYKIILEKEIKKYDDVIILPDYKDSKITKEHKFTVVIEEKIWRNIFGIKKGGFYADIEFKDPIEFPGKGTCDYNCGDDAIFGQSFKIKGEFERYKILSHIATSTYENRNRVYY